MARVEHVNITVSNPAATAQVLEDIFGWHIRWQGHSALGGDTIHVGEAGTASYVAVYGREGRDESKALAHKKGAPLNHIGVVVDDLDTTEARVEAAGLSPFSHGDYAPGRRFYFFDRDGIEWEVVSYD